jgi:hypothetical protein
VAKYSAFNGSRIKHGIFADVDPRAVQSIDVQEAVNKLNFSELVVLIKELEGYRGTEIANLFRDVTGRGSKQRVNKIKQNIKKKFLSCAKVGQHE